MFKHVSKYLLNSLFNSNESPYVRLAETEYSTEFNTLKRFLGRMPNELEAKQIINRSAS